MKQDFKLKLSIITSIIFLNIVVYLARPEYITKIFGPRS